MTVLTRSAAALEVLDQLRAGRLDQVLSRPESRNGSSDSALAFALGMARLAAGEAGAAVQLMRTLSTQAVDDPVVQANWSLALQESGELDAALVASDRLLMLAPRHADGHFNRGLLLVTMNRLKDAVESLRRAVELDPGHSKAWREIGLAQHRRGLYLESEIALRRALDLAPDAIELREDLAVLLYDAGTFEASLQEADAAIEIDATRARAWRARANALRRLGRLAESLAAIDRALRIAPDDADSLKSRGLTLESLNDLPAAAIDLRRAAALRFAPGDTRPSAMREFTRTSIAKLEHDIEQIEHLERMQRLPPEQLERLRRLLVEARQQLPDTGGRARTVDWPSALLKRVHGAYNRLHWLAPAPALPGGALSPALDGAAIESDYLGRGAGITWIDGFLRPEALEALRRYCLESTFWFDFHHANGYMGAFFEDGFAADLLLQIAEDLRRLCPNLIKDHPLMQLWAFKYDSQLQGIEWHADIAAVNVNFWITPDEANLDPERGGLVVMDKEAPADWGFDDYNTSSIDGQARIERFLAESGASAVRVPYRQNRAVVFNSDLFHRTDDIHFREGYENRRINVTMLFGQRAGRTR